MQRRLAAPPSRYASSEMLRNFWTGLYGALAAGATMAARRAASKVWRVATGEEPPVKQK